MYELLQLLGMKNVRLDDVRQMISETDKDGSGSVDFEEFLQARTHISSGMQTAGSRMSPAGFGDKWYVCSWRRTAHVHLVPRTLASNF